MVIQTLYFRLSWNFKKLDVFGVSVVIGNTFHFPFDHPPKVKFSNFPLVGELTKLLESRDITLFCNLIKYNIFYRKNPSIKYYVDFLMTIVKNPAPLRPNNTTAFQHNIKRITHHFSNHPCHLLSSAANNIATVPLQVGANDELNCISQQLLGLTSWCLLLHSTTSDVS